MWIVGILNIIRIGNKRRTVECLSEKLVKDIVEVLIAREWGQILIHRRRKIYADILNHLI